MKGSVISPDVLRAHLPAYHFVQGAGKVTMSPPLTVPLSVEGGDRNSFTGCWAVWSTESLTEVELCLAVYMLSSWSHSGFI